MAVWCQYSLHQLSTMKYWNISVVQCRGLSSWMLPTCQNAGRHTVCGWLQDSGLPGDHLWGVFGQVEGEPQAGGVLFGGRGEAEPGAHPGGHPYSFHLTLRQLYHAGGWELPATGKGWGGASNVLNRFLASCEVHLWGEMFWAGANFFVTPRSCDTW